MICSTLKANREHETKFVDFVDECIHCIGSVFGEDYVDDMDYTDWDKLEQDYSTREIESVVLKWIRADAKDWEDGYMFQVGKFFITREFAYDDLEELLKKGLLTGGDLRKVKKDQKKFNFKVEKDIRNEEGYWHLHYIDDLIEEYFPCNYDLEGECTNCGNCD